jgi:DNA-binding CsgD family transcriptional regulator
MLLKFVFFIRRKRYSDYRLLLVLWVIVSIAILMVVLVQKGVIHTTGDPDLFIIRLFLITNLLIHLFLFFAFRKSKRNYEEFNHVCFGFKHFMIYFSGVAIYTVILSFFNVFGFISICFSILILFAVSISIPVLVKLNFRNQSVEVVENIRNPGFDEFCLRFEISKREAEIIREICSGKSNKAIAEKLFITLQTVKDHTHHIYTKTEVSSRMQLANLVREKTGEPD